MADAPPLVCFHNHLIPGVDDGARSGEDARNALLAMREQGVRRLVATPHFDVSLTERPDRLERRLAELDAGWERLQSVADAAPDVRIGRGAELMVDIPNPRLDDARLRLEGGRAVLVEFAWSALPPGSGEVVYELRVAGHLPVVAHPERHRDFQGPKGLARLQRWLETGAVVQMNAGSLIGAYGDRVRRTAWGLLERGWVCAVCSDFHPRPGRRPVLREAFDALVRAGGERQARLLFSDNPIRILDGEDPEPVPPLRADLLTRLKRLLPRR